MVRRYKYDEVAGGTDSPVLGESTVEVEGKQVVVRAHEDGAWSCCPFGRKTYTFRRRDALLDEVREALIKSKATRRKRPTVEFVSVSERVFSHAKRVRYRGVHAGRSEHVWDEWDETRQEWRTGVSLSSTVRVLKAGSDLGALEALRVTARKACEAYREAMEACTTLVRVDNVWSHQDTERKVRTEAKTAAALEGAK